MKWGNKMKWGSKKPVSWFSKLSGSSKLKPAKEKKQDDEASQKISTKFSLSSTKRGKDIHESSKRLQKISVEKENATRRPEDMESNEKFEEIMSSVKKKARDFQRETHNFLEVEAMNRDKGTVIMTPRIQVKRDKKRFERRDQKLLKQKSEVQVQKSATRTCTRSNIREDFVKLKKIKLREVKLKADQQRKSMYLRKELGTKENSKVRVFSPRACRVKAIEDLKKAKLRVHEDDGGGMEMKSFAVVKCSSDPQKDFRDSMVEMIMENGIINHPEELKELLVCYLRLNTNEYYDMIISVFQQVHSDLHVH
ncbi:unnamed protein product [Eruca vesicaria subsp. sativa]|uniref:Transcription repressor n=1 Tax=Eruca vesicaria subsp. sativa TaxID=29727 RepID=A0ABC8LJ09_ERUVS|nr:unnamed protein product [Eruca vesicaria subsp. sativa]